MKDDPRWEFFKCQRCGRCCIEIGLPYDADSTRAIADFLNISFSEVIERYYGKVVQNGQSLRLLDEKRKPCPFLEKDEERYICKVYPVRPLGCKLYPFATDFGCGGVACPAARIANYQFDMKSISPDNQGKLT